MIWTIKTSGEIRADCGFHIHGLVNSKNKKRMSKDAIQKRDSMQDNHHVAMTKLKGDYFLLELLIRCPGTFK